MTDIYTQPQAWIPENAGDELLGVLLRYEKGSTQYGEVDVAVLDAEKAIEKGAATSSGPRSVWLFQTTLRSGFARKRPEPGEKVGIRYDGKRKSRNPTPGRASSYHDFKVVVPDRQGSSYTPAWEDDGAIPEEEQRAMAEQLRRAMAESPPLSDEDAPPDDGELPRGPGEVA